MEGQMRNGQLQDKAAAAVVGAIIAAGTVVTALVALAPGKAAAQAGTIGACSPTSTKFATSSTATMLATSATFTTLPRTTLSFRQGGASASCVIVQFSTQLELSSQTDLAVRALLDGTTAALPAELLLEKNGHPSEGPRTVIFIFPSVAPGTHSLRMEYRMPGTGIKLGPYNTVVQFAP
jgi:hypothetical protein